jgi:mevalonate kinase
LGHLPAENIFACAHKLEHPFHSQSSGCDVMGALQETPFIYQMDAPVQPLILTWQPHLYLSHCGEHAATHTCVEQVQHLQSQDPQKATALDQRMQQATDEMITALQTTKHNRRDTLQHAITCAADCFEAWQLTSPTLTAHMQQLTQRGALACKPTGAGGGGLILSLWATPPTHQAIGMIPVFSRARTASTS